MLRRNPLVRYIASLSTGTTVLWCYFLWYLITVYNYFDPTVRIWLNALGQSAVIGIALNLSVNKRRFRDLAPWPTFRLFLVPFCVSSFSSLIKGQGFIVMLPPKPAERLASIGACVALVLLVALVKRIAPSEPASEVVP